MQFNPGKYTIESIYGEGIDDIVKTYDAERGFVVGEICKYGRLGGKHMGRELGFCGDIHHRFEFDENLLLDLINGIDEGIIDTGKYISYCNMVSYTAWVALWGGCVKYTKKMDDLLEPYYLIVYLADPKDFSEVMKEVMDLARDACFFDDVLKIEKNKKFLEYLVGGVDNMLLPSLGHSFFKILYQFLKKFPDEDSFFPGFEHCKEHVIKIVSIKYGNDISIDDVHV